MGDYYDENGVHQPEWIGKPERSRLNPIVVLFVAFGLIGALVGVGAATLGGDEATVAAPKTAPPPTFSQGITQAQLDRLGDSIEARYASGDTEVAQALLDNFMDAHPECVSAVMGGGEGKMREVLRQSEQVAAQLRSTAPHPRVYTTVITVKLDKEGTAAAIAGGRVRAAVLGVSCEE